MSWFQRTVRLGMALLLVATLGGCAVYDSRAYPYGAYGANPYYGPYSYNPPYYYGPEVGLGFEFGFHGEGRRHGAHRDGHDRGWPYRQGGRGGHDGERHGR